MANNNLQQIKLGAPSSIEGGASPNAELSVQYGMNLKTITLKDDTNRCTQHGALSSLGKIFNNIRETGTEVVGIQDPEVERILRENGLESGFVGVTEKDLAKLTTVPSFANSNFQYFTELKFFNNTSIAIGAFTGCHNIKELAIKGIGRAVFSSAIQNRLHDQATAEHVDALDCYGYCQEIDYGLHLTKCHYIACGMTGGTIGIFADDIHAYFLPNVTSIGLAESGGYSFVDTKGSGIKIVDLGKNISTFKRVQGLKTSALIIRNKKAPTELIYSMAKIYVPSMSLEEYKNTNSIYANSNIYAIGGAEWAEEFGSSDEYADIDKYVEDIEERARIKAAYEEAKG